MKSVALAALIVASSSPLAGNAQQTPAQGGEPAQQGPAQQARRPRPYNQVITDRAVSTAGGITVHRVDTRWFFEVPDSLVGRDFLLVSRIAGVPANMGGFTSAGQSLAERMVRWERIGDRVTLRRIPLDAYADDSLPIALSVHENNIGPILAAFPIQAYGRADGRDSATYVIDVTDFFGGDTPAFSGLSPQQKRQYQVRRLDPQRSYVNSVRTFPLNVEVRHTETFDAGEPPADTGAGSISLVMRESLDLLPKEPMRPRYADPRVGFFTIDRVNYGLNEQKAATQTFIVRWRLEPKDPAAYARGELVEPVKPIVYYIDPATPAEWRQCVKDGVQNWQRVFEKAGFKNAIQAKDPPTPEQDPTWDPEDIRFSVVRWAASLVRNAVGPNTHDPRTGEIINSEITWYHNHMRSYRNRLMIETGAANPAARTLDIPEDLMCETMRQVVTHEIGHAIGLEHNMIASNSFPVDSLRKPSFTHQYGVSATIMDYARQNYVAQPGDGLQPKDFIRRVGPFDDFVINWGYRIIPEAKTPEAERPVLNRWITSQTGPFAYRYVPQQYGSVDPRAQTEDLGDDAVKASGYAIANMKRVVPNLVQWTEKPGEDYSDLDELYGETLGMWSLYMGHVTTEIGGVYIDLKSAEQAGAVYTVVPKEKQKQALAFLTEQAIRTPAWLAPESIISKIGPQPAGSLLARQEALITQLLDVRRLDRLSVSETLDPTRAYALTDYLNDLKRAVFGAPAAPVELDPGRRAMQRVYVERLNVLINPPAPAAAGGRGGGPATPQPFLVAPNVARSDLPAVARAQLRSIRDQAKAQVTSATGAMARAHWQDIADRADGALNPRGAGAR